MTDNLSTIPRNLTKEQVATSIVHAILFDSGRLSKEQVHGLGYCSKAFRKLTAKKLKAELLELAYSNYYAGDVRDERYQRELDSWCMPTILDKCTVAFPDNFMPTDAEIHSMTGVIHGSVIKIRGQHLVYAKSTGDCSCCAFRHVYEPCQVRCRTYIYLPITPWQAFLHKLHIKRIN